MKHEAKKTEIAADKHYACEAMRKLTFLKLLDET